MLHAVEKEVFVSRIAALAGYPVAETRLIEYEERPWLAYAFVENASDWGKLRMPYSSPNVALVVRNPEAVWTRTLFNALVDAEGDSAHQGIIDEDDNKYYANDINLGIRSDESRLPLEQVVEQLKTSMYRYGSLPPDTEAGRAAAAGFVDRISQLSPEDFKGVFRDYIGSQAETAELAQALAGRAQALKVLFEQNGLVERDG